MTIFISPNVTDIIAAHRTLAQSAAAEALVLGLDAHVCDPTMAKSRARTAMHHAIAAQQLTEWLTMRPERNTPLVVNSR